VVVRAHQVPFRPSQSELRGALRSVEDPHQRWATREAPSLGYDNVGRNNR
jgi:hypothetical protein